MEKGILISEAARVLEAHPETIRRWERRGLLRAKRDYRGFRVFDPEEVSLLKKRKQELTEAKSSRMQEV
jgi:DNA (cytosine-5)-methyltransferase 1